MIDDPLNTHIQWPQGENGDFLELRVVGVMKDVHYSSVENRYCPDDRFSQT